LTKKQQLLMVGQPYRVLVHIDMPESPKNQNLGMFMVCAEMRDQQTNLRGHSCRPVVMRYKSQLLQTITTWLLAPFLIMGFREERQHIPVELFSNYEDDQSHPVTEVYIEIQSRQVEFYGVQLHVTAHFTGLRYIMFHYPILSAGVGISTNLFFILIVCLLSWYHWSDKEWLEGAKEKYKSFRSKASLDFGSHSDAGEFILRVFREKVLKLF
jgi:seipin